MALIPQAVFDKYDEFASAMVDELGETCELIYPDTITTLATTVSTLKQKKTMLLEPGDHGFARSTENLIATPNKETVKFRVYWDKKAYKKLSDVSVPEGGIMCISKLVTLPKIRKANGLVIHKVVDGSHEEFLFQKFAESQLHGLNNNYVISFWARS